jgi:hypothetical protein
VDAAFARDLGYLDKFFDKIEAHAASLDATRGARLRALVAEERTRWAEIRGLIGGTTSVGARAEAPAPEKALAPAPKPALTVGSLIQR